MAKIYRNESAIKNTKPSPPKNLRSSLINGELTMAWDAASDQQTPVNGLYYNLRVGTSNGGKDVMAPHANSGGTLTTPSIGNVQQNKTWVLRGLNPNLTYYWAVQAIDGCFAGSEWAPAEVKTSIADNYSDSPRQYSLQQNYPNPFNPETSIRFGLPAAGEVELSVYNMLGGKVRTLANRKYDAGWHQMIWTGTDESGQPVSSGIYFIKLTADQFTSSIKVSLVR